MRNLSFFDDQRSSLEQSIELTAQSLTAYGESYKRWAIAFSGGKDSSAVVSVVLHLIEAGRVPKPETLTILYGSQWCSKYSEKSSQQARHRPKPTG